MGAAITSGDDEPVMEINTTPLIDVMLVLLIMFIITIPIQTHSVPIDLPSGAPPPTDVRRDRNHVAVEADGRLLWNGAAVEMDTLRRYLDAAARLEPAPELHLQPHPEARYELVDEVLATTKRANVRSMGIIGNERFGNF